MKFGIGSFMCVAGEMKDDVQKLEFTVKALMMKDPFAHELAMHEDIRECLAWQTGKSAEEIMREREVATQHIEEKGRLFWQSGKCAEWFKGADPLVAHIAREVNGPLCEYLCERLNCFLFDCLCCVCAVCVAFWSGTTTWIRKFPSSLGKGGRSMEACRIVEWVVQWKVKMLLVMFVHFMKTD